MNALADRGDEVVAIDRGPRPFRDDVQFVDADIRDAEAMREHCRGASGVYHSASIVHTRVSQEDTIWSVNLDGSRNVLRACQGAGVPRLVYVSTASAVYEGRDIKNGDESLPYSTVSQAPYSESKIAAERELLSANGKDDVSICAIRPHVVFGPGDQRFLPAILARAKAGKLRYAVGRGDKLSDFTYVSNLVDALLLADAKMAAGIGVAGEAYFITNGEPMPFFDFVKRVLKRLDLPPIRGSVPFTVAYLVAAVAEGIDTLRGGTLNSEDGLSRFAVRYMCTHHYFSIDKARRELGYEPTVSIAEGIDRTVKELRATESQT